MHVVKALDLLLLFSYHVTANREHHSVHLWRSIKEELSGTAGGQE